MINFLEYANRREAVREYTREPIDRADLLYCLEAARLAPSALNSQPWKFVVVDDPHLLSKVAAAVYNPILRVNRFVLDATAITVVLRDISGLNSRVRTMVRKFNFSYYDIGMAVENFCLAGLDRDIGTCVIGWFNQRRLRDLLFIPDDKEIALVIAMGRPSYPTPREKERRPLEEIHSFNTYQ